MERNKKGQFTKKSTCGKNNVNWNGGRWTCARYIKILLPEHPYCDGRGYYREHRYVAELAIKRYLKKEEVIHHIDGNNHNNKIENLYLFKNHPKHMSYHSNYRYGNCKKITKSNLTSIYSNHIHSLES